MRTLSYYLIFQNPVFSSIKTLKQHIFKVIFSPINKFSLSKLKDQLDTLNCWGIYRVSYQCGLSYMGQTKRRLYFRLYEINSVFEINKPTNPPLTNIAGKMTALLIFSLLKLFANPTLHLNFTSSKHSTSMKIIIMLSTVISPSLFYQIVRNFTLNLDSSYFIRLFKYLFLLFSYMSISWLFFLTLVFTV